MKNSVILLDIDYTIFDTAKFKESGLVTYSGYGEDEDSLERLSQLADLGIFSQGEDSFQKAKLHRTEMQKFFNDKDIHIHIDKSNAIKEVLERYKGRRIFFVDDKLDVLAKAKTINPEILTVWIRRGIYARNINQRPDFNPDKTINNLLELLPIVGA